MLAESTRRGGIDKARGIHGAHLQCHAEIDFAHGEAIHEPHEAVVRIAPHQDMHAGRGAFAQDFAEAFVGGSGIAVGGSGETEFLFGES